MIERCSFCGETHETGGDDTIGGMPIKECPTIPNNIGGYFLNPKEWKMVIDSAQPALAVDYYTFGEELVMPNDIATVTAAPFKTLEIDNEKTL